MSRIPVVVLLLLSCRGRLDPPCPDAPSEPPSLASPCPAGSVEYLCPAPEASDPTCRHCVDAELEKHGPALRWFVREERVLEVFPDPGQNNWHNVYGFRRQGVAEAGWFASGALHGRYVAWHPNGAKWRDATYCRGVVTGARHEWNERGEPVPPGEWLSFGVGP